MMNYLTASAADAAPGVEEMGYTPAQEAMARKNGFRNYDEMRVWVLAKQRNDGSTAQQSAGVRTAPSIQQGVNAAKAMHPSTILGYVADAYKRATGQ